MQVVLASASPRRRELLRLICPEFSVEVPRCAEDLPHGISPASAVAALALRKAKEVSARLPERIVIGSDTAVALGRRILGKPQNRDEAQAMLRDLAGRSHRVHTGVAVLRGNRERTFVSSADVTFAPMSREEIAAYAASGECDDKAGSYAVQGMGARFIERVNGDFYAVMGLPLCPLYRVLVELGLSSTELSLK